MEQPAFHFVWFQFQFREYAVEVKIDLTMSELVM
jgi:hypothetical protein